MLFLGHRSQNLFLLVAFFNERCRLYLRKWYANLHRNFYMKMYFSPVRKAFTLIELMIVIAIIAILATIAIPTYTNYTQKAALSEILRAAASYKSDVEICLYNNNGNATNCSAGTNGIQANKTTDDNAKYLKSVSVSGGVISVAGKGSIENYSYQMTPSMKNNNITWTISCSGTDTGLFPANFCHSTQNQ